MIGLKKFYQSDKKCFTSPHLDNRLSSAAVYEKDKYYISLVRQITNNLNVPQGFAEVVQRYDQIFQPVKNLDNSNVRITVFCQDGEIIYPLNASGELGAQYAVLYEEYMGSSDENGEWLHLKSRKEHILFLDSVQSDFLMAINVPDSYLMADFESLMTITVGVILIVIVFMVPFCYWASKSFTKPIYRLYNNITSIDLETLSDNKFQSIESNILELSELDRVIRVMKNKLKSSMEKLLLTQAQETQSRILALQAQTNPHFIYNTLSTISAMASENMNDEIETICEKLSGLLRYSSEAKESMVTLEKELEYVQMYVDCMKTRFSELEYIVDIPDELRNTLVPKLIIQLLVENSIKYCTTIKPPWTVRVSGRFVDSGFKLVIEDNGPGFNEDVKEKLLGIIKKIESTKLLPSLELNGMGVLNVYIRMLLIFQNNVYLSISNKQQGGAVVTLKAPILTNIAEEKDDGVEQ
ncbi:MAG: sensor histidine kinase [Acetivibrionales bacterium]